MAYDAEIAPLSGDALILQKARDEIAKGWCAFEFEDSRGNVCSLGALNRVLRGDASLSLRTFSSFVAHLGFMSAFDLADCNNAQTSVEPVLARFDAAIERLTTPQLVTA